MSGARPRSKYNAPVSVGSPDRWLSGNRRWSFFLQKPKEPKSRDIVRWWTIIRGNDPGSGGGLDEGVTWTCDCPDFQQSVSAEPSGEWDRIYYPSKFKFKPKVFPAEAISRYQSQWARYQRGVGLISKVEIVGLQNETDVVFRVRTDRIEEFNRDWSSSEAGIDVDAGEYCKHIFACKLFFGDEVTPPTDIPDTGLGDFELNDSFWADW